MVPLVDSSSIFIKNRGLVEGGKSWDASIALPLMVTSQTWFSPQGGLTSGQLLPSYRPPDCRPRDEP